MDLPGTLNGPVMAERGELLRWLLRYARRYPVSEG